MSTVHQTEVGKLANEMQAADDAEMRQSSTVRAAQSHLDAARAVLTNDPHNALKQQAMRDAERGYNAATNEVRKNKRLAAIEADKASKRAVVEQAESARVARIEADARAAREPAWLANGGTPANFEAAWPRMWEEELIRRSAATDAALHRSVQSRSQPPDRVPAAVPVPALPEMAMVEAAPVHMAAPTPDGPKRRAAKNSGV